MPVNMLLRYGKNRKGTNTIVKAGMTSPNRGTTTISSVHVPITGLVHQRGQSSGGSDNDMNHSRNEVSYEKTLNESFKSYLKTTKEESQESI